MFDLGIAVGALVLANHDVFDYARTRRARAVLLACAAAGFAAGWAVMSLVFEAPDPSRTSALRLVASALPNAALLIVPVLASSRWAVVGSRGALL